MLKDDKINTHYIIYIILVLDTARALFQQI